MTFDVFMSCCTRRFLEHCNQILLDNKDRKYTHCGLRAGGEVCYLRLPRIVS